VVRLVRRSTKGILVLILLTIVVSVVVAAVEGWRDYQHDRHVDQTMQIFDRYVANHSDQTFTEPHVRAEQGAFIACGRPRHGGAPLCLVIHPDRQAKHRVSGSYSRRGRQHIGCRGEARRLRLCRRG
jgi:hypothetical protein